MDETLDLISLCSPSRKNQAKDAIECLRAGKHVYAEKPAAFSEKELPMSQEEELHPLRVIIRAFDSAR